jgi:hypothetical protein
MLSVFVSYWLVAASNNVTRLLTSDFRLNCWLGRLVKLLLVLISTAILGFRSFWDLTKIFVLLNMYMFEKWDLLFGVGRGQSFCGGAMFVALYWSMKVSTLSQRPGLCRHCASYVTTLFWVTLMLAQHWDFCVQNFQNPGTGTSAILVITEDHSLFWYSTQHYTHLWLGGKLHQHHSAKLELAMSTLHKVKSVKTALSNTRFIQITKSNET